MTRFSHYIRFTICLILGMSFSMVSVAQEMKVVQELDTVDIGALIRLTGEKFPHIEKVSAAGWELVSVTENQALFQIFEPGVYPLPTITGKNGEEIQLISDQNVMVVTLPESVSGDAAVRSIEGPVLVSLPWLVKWRWGMTITGTVLFCLTILLASIRSFGPGLKGAPPASELSVLREEMREVQQIQDADLQFSQSQMMFRKVLGLMGQPQAGSATVTELEQNSVLGAETGKQSTVFALLRSADEKRFGGEPVSSQEAIELRKAVTNLLDETKEKQIPRDQSYWEVYGYSAPAFSRMIAGLMDLVPLTMVFLGLLSWPELLQSLPISPDSMLMTTGTALGLGLLGKSIIEWMGITSSWQASPGMRIMKMAVVSSSPRLWSRPWLSLLASIPAFIGHIGIFSASRRSVPDRLSDTQIRSYRETE